MNDYETLFGGDGSTARKETAGSNIPVSRWNLGTHSENPMDEDALNRFNVLVDAAEDYAPGVSDLLNQARQEAQSMSVRDFVCPRCGLGHGHDDTKHDVRSAFNVDPDFVEEYMQWHAFCHCGCHEAAALVENWESMTVPMFTDESEKGFDIDTRRSAIRRARDNAPVPDHVQRKIQEDFNF